MYKVIFSSRLQYLHNIDHVHAHTENHVCDADNDG